jgi:hypothetical protein
MPFSVVKGEVFKVKASLFNYENTCLPVNKFKSKLLFHEISIIVKRYRWILATINDYM